VALEPMEVDTRSVISVDDMDTDPGHGDVGERPAADRAFASQREDRDNVAKPFTQHEKRTLRKAAKQLIEFRHYTAAKVREPNARRKCVACRMIDRIVPVWCELVTESPAPRAGAGRRGVEAADAAEQAHRVRAHPGVPDARGVTADRKAPPLHARAAEVSSALNYGPRPRPSNLPYKHVFLFLLPKRRCVYGDPHASFNS